MVLQISAVFCLLFTSIYPYTYLYAYAYLFASSYTSSPASFPSLPVYLISHMHCTCSSPSP